METSIEDSCKELTKSLREIKSNVSTDYTNLIALGGVPLTYIIARELHQKGVLSDSLNTNSNIAHINSIRIYLRDIERKQNTSVIAVYDKLLAKQTLNFGETK